MGRAPSRHFPSLPVTGGAWCPLSGGEDERGSTCTCTVERPGAPRRTSGGCRRPSCTCAAVAGELIEKIDLVDEFTNPKKGKTSHCYRITYRSMDRSLTDDEVNKMQEDLRERAANELAVELR